MPVTLNDLPIGRSATVESVGASGALRQHFLDMGLIPQATVTMVKRAPMGDPIEVRIRSYELTLRVAEAQAITITNIREPEPIKSQTQAVEEISHPGYGEGGKFHEKKTEKPLPEGKVLTFALAGNQNCGKTTLFNKLTGSNQHVGNFPGVTVDRKDGSIIGHSETLVTDLPGIYSLSPYTNEEIVSREFILKENPDAIINIVDATNIERNLYLTMQLMELGRPMVLALNMMDEVWANGGSVRVNEMEALLGMPVVPISASRGEGIEELIDHAIHVAKYQEPPTVQDFCDSSDHGGAVHRCLHSIMHIIEDHAQKANIPLRFAASKIAEGDALIMDQLDLDINEKRTIAHIIKQLEAERGLDRAAAIADMRFSFIDKVCAQTVVKPRISREHIRSLAIDEILTGRLTAIPAFIAIMALVFWLTFNVIGVWLSDALDWAIGLATEQTDAALTALNVNASIHSLIIDAIFNGVGSVLSFLPTIVVLFFFLSFLEDSGYMARVAFVMDTLLRRIGLSGRSIVPMLIGFGCTVPGVMASRTLPSERDRKMTILLTPFMSCSAKLPIYAFFVAAFFPGEGALIMISLYVLGIIVAVILGYLMKNTVFKGEAVPFVMELPNYRLPGAKNVMLLLWDKAKDFLQRAFTVIFVATIVIWFLQTFDFQLNPVENSQSSILAVVAGWISPIFAPLGFDDWRITTALIGGFMAKESVVSSLSVLFGSTEALTAALSTLTALALLVFCLLYTPCVASIATIKRELGGQWAVGVALFQCVIAWIVAFIVRLIGLVLGY
ncbi:ferrous iron transport protein B [Parasutterella secunda]|uniref:Ferrous iron transport protein B n=1 Tax=Parasutterella secunda TaxID=626947 RepID=A0ABS2GTL0_9BURK|nr:ferrous iron transport protein B [Parasutterella secunda]MBM6928709.1 ferrous iron transport protein B [Parasutterella secunda]